MHHDTNDANVARLLSTKLVSVAETRLESVYAELDTLRHQPLDPRILDKVMRAEREAERWSRTAAALERRAPLNNLFEDPGMVVARVLGAVREEWSGTGLVVSSSFRKLGPRCFDRRAYLDAIRTVADMLLASIEQPRGMRGRLAPTSSDGLIVELIAQGDGIQFHDAELDMGRFLVERAGGEIEVCAEDDQIRAEIILHDHSPATESRKYIFSLHSGE